MISYEVVEKIMKFSKIKFFFRSGDQKTRFSTTKFQGVFGSKMDFLEKSLQRPKNADLTTTFQICQRFGHYLLIPTIIWPISADLSNFRINKIEKNFLGGPKIAKNRFSQKLPKSVIDAQNWSQIIFQDLGKSFQAIYHHFS